MSLKELQLDPFLLATLFQEPLVPDKILPKTTIPYRGGFGKNVLILTTGEIATAQANMLDNLLVACGLNLGDVAIVQLDDHSGLTAGPVCEALGPQIVLAFGEIEMANINGKNTICSLEGRDFLRTDSLQELSADGELKKKLWPVLKKLFRL